MRGSGIGIAIGLGIVGLLLPAPAAADRPNQASVDVAEEIGILSRTHTTITAAYARRIWRNQAFLEARFGVGANADMLMVEDRVGTGLVFTPSDRAELLVGWRLGSSYLRGKLNDAPYSTHVLALEVVILIGIAITPAWRLRVAPATPTVFWNRTYAASVGLELGAGHAF